MQFNVTKAMAVGGWRVGWRLGLFTGGFMLEQSTFFVKLKAKNYIFQSIGFLPQLSQHIGINRAYLNIQLVG